MHEKSLCKDFKLEKKAYVYKFYFGLFLLYTCIKIHF